MARITFLEDYRERKEIIRERPGIINLCPVCGLELDRYKDAVFIDYFCPSCDYYLTIYAL
jgi:hypothetical protein